MSERRTKILAITGANGSGKTTMALKIAKELEKYDNEICIVNFDTISPLSTIKSNYEKYNISLGYILTKDTATTQHDIYTSMIPLTDKISIISYIYGDMKDKYPKLLSNRIRDVIDLLTGTVNYIILDLTSNIIKIENRTCMQVADKILNIIEPTYKSIAYDKTYNLLLERIEIDKEKIIYLANKIIYDLDYKANIMKMGIKYYYELPYLTEIKKNENNPFKTLEGRTHETEKYKRNFKKIINHIYKIEYNNEEIEEESKVYVSEFVNLTEKKETKDDLISKKIENLKNENNKQKTQEQEIKEWLKDTDDEKEIQHKRKSILDSIFGSKKTIKNEKKSKKKITTQYIDKGDEY